MRLLFNLAAFGEGLWIIPVLTFGFGLFFFIKGYFEQKEFKSKDGEGNVAPFWKYAPTVAGIILLLATVVIVYAINSEW